MDGENTEKMEEWAEKTQKNGCEFFIHCFLLHSPPSSVPDVSIKSYRDETKEPVEMCTKRADKEPQKSPVNKPVHQ
jgi:hypothetical protein